MASMTIGRGTPSPCHFFISAQSLGERMNGVLRRMAKCASISRKYESLTRFATKNAMLECPCPTQPNGTYAISGPPRGSDDLLSALFAVPTLTAGTDRVDRARLGVRY